MSDQIITLEEDEHDPLILLKSERLNRRINRADQRLLKSAEEVGVSTEKLVSTVAASGQNYGVIFGVVFAVMAVAFGLTMLGFYLVPVIQSTSSPTLPTASPTGGITSPNGV